MMMEPMLQVGEGLGQWAWSSLKTVVQPNTSYTVLSISKLKESAPMEEPQASLDEEESEQLQQEDYPTEEEATGEVELTFITIGAE